MKTRIENISANIADALEQDIVEDLVSVPGARRKSITPLLVELLLILILGTGCFFLFTGFISEGTSAAFSSFQFSKEDVASSIEQKQYQRGYEWAREKYKITNQMSITVGNLREKSNLEVLRVSEISYRIISDSNTDVSVLGQIAGLLPGNGKVTDFWAAVPGRGVFIISLKNSEFIVDNSREYVLIRVPRPEMAQFAIDYAGIEPYLINETGLTPAKKGKDLVTQQVEAAYYDIKQSISEKEEYEKMAKDSATRILRNMVVALNPQVENLTVEVEFIE